MRGKNRPRHLLKSPLALRVTTTMALMALSGTMLLVGTYAWMSLSSSPVVDGITVVLAGKNTIQLAADVLTETQEGSTHAPGEFSDSLSLTDGGYLLTPVSTADGLNWFQPVYDQVLGSLSGFSDAGELAVNGDDSEGYNGQGCYVYYDFWVLSPGADYTLRLSVGAEDSDEGCYVLSLPELGQDTVEYSLSAAAASLRVGFLVIDSTEDTAAGSYFSGDTADSQVTALRGNVDTDWTAENTDFVIYEPNGDYHDGELSAFVLVGEELVQQVYTLGEYVPTLAITDSTGATAEVTERSIVQKSSAWRANANGVTLAQQYETYAQNARFLGISPGISGFLSWMQNQLDVYVCRGRFVASSSALVQALAQSEKGYLSVQELAELAEDTATQDVSLCTLKGGTAQRIRMFIWLEGQDVDCSSLDSDTQLLIRLELAGS